MLFQSVHSRYRLKILAVFAVVAVSFAIFAPAVLSQQNAPAPSQTAQKKSLLGYYGSGGFLMHPILLCSIGTVAVAVYCFLQINAKRMRPKAHVEALTQQVKAHNTDAACAFCQQNPNTFTNTLSAALLKVNFERDLANKPVMDQAAAEVLAAEETRHMIWVNSLNALAVVTPMLGLLGTVTGMLHAFGKLSLWNSDPQSLTDGIVEAMVATAFGLFVGIPAMCLFFFFRNKLILEITSIQQSVTALIDLLTGEPELEIPEPTPPKSVAEPPKRYVLPR